MGKPIAKEWRAGEKMLRSEAGWVLDVG